MDHRKNTSELLPLDRYDKIVVAFSGGKDSLACILHLLELGVPKDKLVLWHHHIDGAPGSKPFMDWPVTEAYCKAVAEELGIPLRFSWKEGGFEREMLRENALTAPTSFECEDGSIKTVGGTRGKLATRRLFPQVTANLSTRWCSAYLKIDVGRRVFSNDPAYKTGTYLLVTGERREESTARAKYAVIEKHATTNKSRRVDQWRAILDWDEKNVWDAIRKSGIQPHPAYRAGFGRVSCMFCIFGQKNEWATTRELDPERFEKIARYEETFGKTIHRTKSVRTLADEGTSYAPVGPRREATLSKKYETDVKTDDWEMPTGAFKKCGGPS